MTAEEAQIADEAMVFAKANRRAIAKRRTDTAIYPGEDDPVSVFMAGSPGAGKTEASIELLSAFQTDGIHILRIDPDELREEFPRYTGDNAWLFQRAVSILVEKMHDVALEQRQSFILDGTLSNYTVAEKNIERSLGRKRLVQILYVYQEPPSAWKFVEARESQDGRRIRPEHFVDQYFAAREVVERLKVKFGRGIKIDLLLKNLDGSNRLYQANVDRIENYVPEKFSREQVLKIVGL